MLLGSNQVGSAAGAALLLAVNVVCVLLAAKVVFLVKGVKPRTWIERNRARQSMIAYITLWVVLLSVLVGMILLRAPVIV
jgi:uncharacterized membrane protein